MKIKIYQQTITVMQPYFSILEHHILCCKKNFIVGGENLQLRLKFAIAVETPHIKFVPVDSVVLDVECNAFCSIVLGRPFLRTVGAIIDMRDGIIRYQFPLKKGMEHFPTKINRSHFDSIIRINYDVDASLLDNT
jgi:hypothetical protein